MSNYTQQKFHLRDSGSQTSDQGERGPLASLEQPVSEQKPYCRVQAK